MGDRNTEIWCTRLQREILALESSDDESKKIELLPPFIKTIGHTLNIEGGIAKIEFRIDVELAEEEAQSNSAEAEAASGEDAVAVNNAGEDSNEPEKEGGENADKNEKVGDEKEEEANKDAQESTEPETKDAKQTDTEDNAQQEENNALDPHVVLVLDASLYWRPDSTTSQSTSPQCYPFQKPLAVVKSGANLFSGGSTIRNGEEVDIDLDWTPSIHLSDAVTNVALKIRECVKRGEPLHPAMRDEFDGDDEDGLSGSILREAREAKESLLETKKAMGAMFSSGLSSLSAKGSSFAAKGQTASKSMSKSFLTLGESLSQFAEAGGEPKQGEGVAEGGALSLGEEGEPPKPKEVVKKVVKPIPDIGDEIDLSDEPWNQCIGMYSCKAIKRPAFIEAIIAKAAKNQKNQKEVRQ